MQEELCFLSPVDGDVLHTNDGEIAGGVLAMRVLVAAAPGSQVRIAGVSAREEEPGRFSAVIRLSEGHHVLMAESSPMQARARVTVYFDYVGYYRVSIDDAVWFLRDLTDHGYASGRDQRRSVSLTIFGFSDPRAIFLSFLSTLSAGLPGKGAYRSALGDGERIPSRLFAGTAVPVRNGTCFS